MKSMSDMLGSVLRKTGSAVALGPLWEQAVGALIARRTRPVRWEGATLVVRCDDVSWKTALEPELPSLSRRLASALGEPGPVPLKLEVA